MFKRSLIIMMAIVLAICTGFAFAEETVNKTVPLPANSAQNVFSEIQEKVKNSTDKFKTYGAQEAFLVIAENTKAVRQLKKELDKSKHVDEHIDGIAETLTTIAISYRKLADSWPEIKKVHNTEFASLEEAETMTKAKSQEADSKISVLQQSIANAESRLKTEKNDFERKKLQIDIDSYRSVAQSREAEKKIWQKFYEAQKVLHSRLDGSVQKIGLLLHVVDRNADVYEAAAQTAMVRKSAADTVKCLTGVQNIDSILGELQNSWVDVNAMVEKISNADFQIDFKIEG